MILKGSTMSNIEHSAAVINAITTALGAKFSGEDKTSKCWDAASKLLRWTDVVAPTPVNIEHGKSTTTKEAYVQIKTEVEALLKRRGRAHGSTEIGSELKDIKNSLMRRQDPELFAATKGNLGKVEKVDGTDATVKSTPDVSAFDKGQTMARNYVAWVEKNATELGTNYDTVRKAALQMLSASGYKR